ncbi:Putative aminopeptidase YsdC [Anaerohalosphaera lusitana]|uniref:Putative aminopeptidase YsdC n=1 Tax=Anaerohalosphaera lusitana TaxID=1936003 RepID=A0A1U9NP82_9BACT|nr:M20/M25/M40 family metallo-hydrolase [Anaerohalosphaera lusitana]AQT69723.1 Putative aminopeptidase YsdC [Anaerohalosphaera lusitana]
MAKTTPGKTPLQQRILKIGKELLDRPTAPFREWEVRSHIRQFCRDRDIDVREDGMGNLIATYGSEYKNDEIAFAAHMDHPGFIVETDSRGGKCRALFYGGVDEEYFKTGRVRIFAEGGDVIGKITRTEFNKKRNIKRVFMQVDGPVKKGDTGMWDLKPFSVRSDKLYSRACDDLVGCVSILSLFDELKRRRIKKKVVGVFTSAEEAGLQGAKYLCMKRKIAKKTTLIAIETSSQLGNAKMGDGVVIRVGDALSVFTPEVTAFLTSTARKLKKKDKSFKFQRKLMDGGCCESTIYQAFGYKNSAVCIALGNYHNRNFKKKQIEEEYVSVTDLEDMVKLFIATVRDVDGLSKALKPQLPKFKEEIRPLGERLFNKA